MWSTQFGFPYMPFLAFSSPALWCRVFQCCVFQSCSFDRAVFSGLAFSVPRPYTVLSDNSVLITANMQSETGFPSSHQLKSYVASKSRLKLAARCLVSGCWPSCYDCRALLIVCTRVLSRREYRTVYRTVYKTVERCV